MEPVLVNQKYSPYIISATGLVPTAAAPVAAPTITASATGASRSRQDIGPSAKRQLAFYGHFSVAWGEIIGQKRDLLKIHKSLYNKQDGILGSYNISGKI